MKCHDPWRRLRGLILRSGGKLGNTFSLTQQGTSNSASAEQQAIAGSASNSATVFQTAQATPSA